MMAVSHRGLKGINKRYKHKSLTGFILLIATLTSCIFFRHAFLYIVFVVVGLEFFVYWRKGLYFFFFYVCIEGVVSLGLYPWKLPLLFKDFILILLYGGFLAEFMIHRKKILFKNRLNIPLAFLGGLAIFQLFNPSLGSLSIGLVGIRTLLFYIPLFYIGYHSFHTKQKLYRFGLFLAILSIPVSIISVIQYVAGQQTIASLGSGFARSIVGIGTPAGHAVFRPSSTFSSPGHFGGYLLPAILLTVSFANFHAGPWSRRLFWIAFGFAILGLFANTQRSTITILSIAIPGMYLIRRKKRASFKVLLIISICLLISWVYLRGVFYRIDSITRDPYQVIVSDHLVNPMLAQVSKAVATSPFGRGMGSASPGSRYLTQDWTYVESFLAYLIYELGVPGLLLYILMLGLIVGSGLRIFYGLRAPDLRWLAMGLLFYQLGIISQLGTYCPLNHAPTNVYFWFFSGVMMKLLVMDGPKEVVSTHEQITCSLVQLSEDRKSTSV